MSRATLNFPSIGLSDFFLKSEDELFYCSENLGSSNRLSLFLKTDLFDDLIRRKIVGVIFTYTSSMTPRIYMVRNLVVSSRDICTGEVSIVKSDDGSVFNNVTFPAGVDFNGGDCKIQFVVNQKSEVVYSGDDLESAFRNINFTYPEGAILAQLEFSQKRGTALSIAIRPIDGPVFLYRVDADSLQIYVPRELHLNVSNLSDLYLSPLYTNAFTSAFLFCRHSRREGAGGGVLVDNLCNYLENTDDGEAFLNDDLEPVELIEQASIHAQQYLNLSQLDFYRIIGEQGED